MQSEVHFENIKHHIQTELRKATDFVFVAVAWFTDDDLFEELVNLSRKGIQIQLLLNQDEINENSGLDYPILFRNGGMVFFVNAREILMHNKFCVIDKRTVLNGSFNWTRKASSNLENLTIIRDIPASNKFIEQFESLKKKAKTYFEQIDVDHPSFVNSSIENYLNYEQLISRAEKRKENGNYLASLIDLKKAIAIHPDKETELLFDIAYCQSEVDDNENAIQNYSKYIELNPKSTASLNNRGLLYKKTKELKLAYYDFSKAIEIEPKKALYYSNRAELSKKFIPRYKSDFRMPAFMPYNISTTEEISEMLRINKEQDYWRKPNLKKLILQGIEDFLMVIELDKSCDKWDIYSDIGEIYYNIRNHQKSIEYYTKAIRLKSDYDYGYYSRGWSHYILDDFENAISDIEKALKIKPNKTAYQNAIKKIKKEKRKPKNWFK